MKARPSVSTTPFSELLYNVIDNRGKTCPTSEAGIPLIATNCVKNSSLYPSYEKVRYISHETYKNWFRGHPKPGDLIFVTKGAPGQVCIAPDPVNFCIAQDMVALQVDEKKVYPKFLFALLRADQTQAAINNMHVGTMIPHFKKGDFDKLLLPLPDKTVQIFAGDIYYLLSKKIELNRKMNATLEAMARALFKSWFVDFDPVRAKSEGRQPFGMDADTAALFPSRLVPSALGDIPEGWEMGRLSDALELCYGKSLTKEARQDGLCPVYGSGGITGHHSDALVNGPGIIVGRKGTVGSLYWEDRDFFPIDTVFYVVPQKHFSLVYILSQLELLGLENMNTDAAVPGLNRENAYRLDIIKPPQPIVAAFTHNAQIIRNKLRVSNAESERLTGMRDYLLPKLISGEIRIPDSEKMLGGVV